MSGRRYDTSLRDAKAKGLVQAAPHYNSAFRYLESLDLTPILQALIERSAAPLSMVETDFAIDSSGFTSSVYHRWYDAKYKRWTEAHKWVKTHMMCGVKTNIITSVEVTPTESADAPFLPTLLNRTAQTFDVQRMMGDKAYNSHVNMKAIDAIGATPFIPFKVNAKAVPARPDAIWQRAWHFYNFNRGEFLRHYGKRSSAETTFSMLKAKFGTRIRSKTETAQVNEVLCKVLCHNICVMVQSMYELGVSPTFGARN